MIDTDKYEGHNTDDRIWYQYSEGITSDYTDGKSRADEADSQLVADAPLLLAEVKRLRPMADELIAIWEILDEDYPHVDRAIVKELVERKIGDYYLEECNLR